VSSFLLGEMAKMRKSTTDIYQWNLKCERYIQWI